MSAASFSPRFIKANVSFKLNDVHYQAGQHLINSSGIPGFAWTQFDPMKTIGARVGVSVQILSATPWEFNCEALLTAEQTGISTSLGLDTLIAPAEKKRLDDDVAAAGLLPDFARKFPRIHYVARVPVFPSRVILKYFYGHEDISVCCDVDNVSPSGLQVYTDDPRTIALLPDAIVRAQMSPRGPFLKVVHLNASIKRIIHTTDLITGNSVRHFGLAITTMSSETKAAFTDWLRQIVVHAKR